jgi:hypothetical protein
MACGLPVGFFRNSFTAADTSCSCTCDTTEGTADQQTCGHVQALPQDEPDHRAASKQAAACACATHSCSDHSWYMCWVLTTMGSSGKASMNVSSRSSALSMRSAYSPDVVGAELGLRVAQGGSPTALRRSRTAWSSAQDMWHVAAGLKWGRQRSQTSKQSSRSCSPSTHTMAALASGSSSVSRFSHSSEMMPSYLQRQCSSVLQGLHQERSQP